jgi:NTE family protein
MDTERAQVCDLIFEGGGVKCIALIGAWSVLNEHGYVARRVAGTSAGAVAAAFVAAGMPAADIHLGLAGTHYRRFRDPDPLARLGPLGKAASLFLGKGLYEGGYVHDIVEKRLRDIGVRTFADLRITEPWAKMLPPDQRYKLVLLSADVTRGRLVRLPWDYHLYGMDPDKQRVADAVRASTSIPFFYKPAKLRRSLMVDGGLLSKFPVGIFDDTALWPTFGIKLWNKPDMVEKMMPADTTVEYAQAILTTMLNGQDQMHFEDPCVLNRTIFVDTEDVKMTDFDISVLQLERLYVNGRRAAEEFLKTWDFVKFQEECMHGGGVHL